MKAILTTCFAILLSAAAFSQDIAATLKSRTPEEKAMGLTMIMKSKLNLDSIQTAKVQAINTKYALKTDPIMKGDGNKLAKFKQLKDLNKDKDAELKAVFTADQFKQYQVIEEEMKQKMIENLKSRKQG